MKRGNLSCDTVLAFLCLEADGFPRTPLSGAVREQPVVGPHIKQRLPVHSIAENLLQPTFVPLSRHASTVWQGDILVANKLMLGEEGIDFFLRSYSPHLRSKSGVKI